MLFSFQVVFNSSTLKMAQWFTDESSTIQIAHAYFTIVYSETDMRRKWFLLIVHNPIFELWFCFEKGSTDGHGPWSDPSFFLDSWPRNFSGPVLGTNFGHEVLVSGSLALNPSSFAVTLPFFKYSKVGTDVTLYCFVANSSNWSTSILMKLTFSSSAISSTDFSIRVHGPLHHVA